MRLAVFVLVLAAAAGAQDLSRVRPEQKVQVHLRDGTMLKGVIRDIGPAGFAIVRKEGVVQVQLEEVDRITKGSRLRAAMWTALVTGGIMGGIAAAKAGTLVDKNNPTAKDRAGMAAMFAGLGGGIGAGIGAAVGMQRTIYKNERPRSAPAPGN